MKYMLLIYGDPTKEPKPNTAEFGEMMAGYQAASKKMQADDVMLAGDGLQEVDTATSLRIKSGKVETMDGPFAETREYLGGYYLIDVENLDKALEYAALIPHANYGMIEVRPVMVYDF